MAGIKYRPDVDGLRAIAVSTVMLYHFHTGLFRGGFIGVDVFFVISGYLITSIIAREMAEENFSFVRFYERRVRRIFPVLFIVLFTTSVSALYFLYPEELKDFGRSLAAAVAFVANFYFYSFSGYFRADVETLPLLHTWSLAVEEQYYLVFPIFLLMLYKYRPKLAPVLITIFALVSFAASVLLVRSGAMNAAFYLSPPRFWEMMAGSIVAVGGLPVLRTRLIRDIFSLAGLGLIVGSAVAFKPMMAFPGLYAAAPVAGAAFIIYGNRDGETLAGKLLSWRPFVVVGLLSYSLYLWHWPVSVFYHLKVERPLTPADSIILIPVTLALATASWKLVEQPFRHPEMWRGRIWSINFGMSAALLALGAVLILVNGWPQRFSTEVDKLASYIQYDDRATYRRGTCFLDGELQTPADFRKDLCMAYSAGKPNYLLIGDSHGAHLWNALHATLQHVNVMQATSSGCKPLMTGPGLHSCRDFMQQIYQLILNSQKTGPKLDGVILSARWVSSDIPSLLESVAALNNVGIKPYVLGPIVEYDLPLARLLADRLRAGSDMANILNKRSQVQLVDAQIAHALEGKEASYISVLDIICPPPNKICKTQTSDGIPMQWDYGHLTAEGAVVIAETLKAKLLPAR